MKILRIPFLAIAITALFLGTGCPRDEPEAAPEAPEAPEAAPEADPEAAPEAAPAAEAIRLEPGFMPDPHTATGRAGGPVEAQEEETTHGECVGYLPREPQHTMELTAAFTYLKVQATSEIDTSLVIEGPDGKRCNDDFEGLNPGIEGAWPAGSYRIFVGSYDEEEQGDYTLSITELQ